MPRCAPTFAVAILSLTYISAQPAPYIYEAGPLSWEQAREACLDVGRDLIGIRSAEENTALADWLRDVHNITTEETWIGLYLDNANNLFWIDGTEYTFNGFALFEPDGDGPCMWMLLESSFSGAGGWSDAACSDMNGFVCDATPINDGTAEDEIAVPVVAIVVRLVLLLLLCCSAVGMYVHRSGKWTCTVVAGVKEREFDADRGYDQERDFATEMVTSSEIECVDISVIDRATDEQHFQLRGGTDVCPFAGRIKPVYTMTTGTNTESTELKSSPSSVSVSMTMPGRPQHIMQSQHLTTRNGQSQHLTSRNNTTRNTSQFVTNAELRSATQSAGSSGRSTEADGFTSSANSSSLTSLTSPSAASSRLASSHSSPVAPIKTVSTMASDASNGANSVSLREVYHHQRSAASTLSRLPPPKQKPKPPSLQEPRPHPQPNSTPESPAAELQPVSASPAASVASKATSKSIEPMAGELPKDVFLSSAAVAVSEAVPQPSSPASANRSYRPQTAFSALEMNFSAASSSTLPREKNGTSTKDAERANADEPPTFAPPKIEDRNHRAASFHDIWPAPLFTEYSDNGDDSTKSLAADLYDEATHKHLSTAAKE